MPSLDRPEARTHIQLRSLTRICTSRDGNHASVGPITLEILQGELLSIIGPRGCGKSTLLKLLAGLLLPTSGEVLISGERVETPRTDAGFVFQQPALLEWRSVQENIMLQAEVRGLDIPKSRNRALRLLACLGLSGLADRRAHELPLEKQQRVSIARALLHDPPLLFMDDPFQALDPLSRESVCSDFQRLWMAEGRTVVLVTQNVGEAVQLSDRVVVMMGSPGQVAQILTIDLPRPRRFDKAMTPPIADYCSRIRLLFQAEGLLT